MLPKYHIILGFLFAIMLKAFSPLDNAAIGIIFLSSFLIDIDHYLAYIALRKDFDWDNAYEWFAGKRAAYKLLSLEERRKAKKVIFIFHGIEAFILLLILSLWSKVFIYILIGFAFHLLIDLIEGITIKEIWYNKVSQIITFIANKGKKKFY